MGNIMDQDLLKLISTSTVLKTIRSVAVLIFESRLDNKREREVSVLTCLLHIISMPALVTVASGEAIADTIELFVVIISECQISQSESGFTFQQRSRCVRFTL